MATEAAIELLEKKRLDLPFLSDANSAIATIQNDPTGCELLVKLPDGTTFSLGGLKERLKTNGAQETAMVATVEAAVATAFNVPATVGSVAAAIFDLITAYNADIAAE